MSSCTLSTHDTGRRGGAPDLEPCRAVRRVPCDECGPNCSLLYARGSSAPFNCHVAHSRHCPAGAQRNDTTTPVSLLCITMW
jgi:hypothetical protein